MFTMSIVLPRRRRKHDIFAPRKSIQDAKEKLGPGFFDPTLLECSRNAVALNKLVEKWDHIDKERVKFLRNLTREQNFLASFYKTHKIRSGSRTSATAVDSTHRLETSESRQIPPGFRYKSNGDLKQSCTTLSRLHISGNEDLPSRQTEDSEEGLQDYDSVDYRKEIETLQNVIINICRELIRSKASLNQDNSTYLRAHSNEYVSIGDLTGAMYQYDRFAYQPRSSERSLHKLTTKTPSSRSCVGCQFKLRQPIDNFQLHLKRDSNLLKRRWSYVPSGKYVESSTILRPADSSPTHHASEILESSKSSPDHLRADSEIVHRKAVSFKEPQNKKTYFGLEKRPKSCPNLAKLNKRKDASWVSAPILKGKKHANACRDIPASPTYADNSQPSSAMGSGLSGRSESRSRDLASSTSFKSNISCSEIPASPTDSDKRQPSSAKGSGLRGRSGSRSRDLALSTSFRSDRTSSRMLADFDSRLCLLKAYQADQAKQCDSKISRFIKELDSSKKGKKT